MELVVVGAALAAGFGLGATRRRASGLSDYVLAGRALTLPSFVATLVPTFYGGVLGVGEFTWRSGLSNWTVMALPYYVFAAAYALFLAGRVRLEPGLTIPDHLERAYGRPMALAGAALVFLIALPADELLMCGTLLSHLGGWPRSAVMAGVAAFAAGLLWRGGLRADVASNKLQIALMFGGFSLILPAAFDAMPADALRGSLPAGHLSLDGGMSPARLLAWWLIASWTMVDPSFHQRCAAAKDPRAARLGIIASVALWALFDLMTTTAGLYARALHPNLADPLLAFPALADGLLPPLARGFFYAGMACTIAAALQGGALQASIALGKDAAGRLLGGDDARLHGWARMALLPTLALAWLLAELLPSVVALWYAVGSAAIPGLLLPMLGAYFPRLRPRPGAAAPAAAAGCAVSTALLAWDWRPFGLEPMLPGLLACAVIWFGGRRAAP